MASCSNHDKIFKLKYQHLIAEWINNVKLKLGPKTKLVPHKVNSFNGETVQGTRGSSTFCLPSINEYRRGKSGSGDIDSGPVIFEVGFAGTIVSIGTFSVLGDQALAEQKYKTINVFGLSYKTPDTKKYLFGQLLIADAFIAWIRSSGLNYIENSNQSSTYWRFKFHLLSLFTIAILWLLF